MQTFYGHDGIVTCLDLNGPYGTMVTASRDRTTRVWDLTTFKCLGQLPGHEDYVECMQLEDTTLVTGSKDNTIRMWNLADLHHLQDSRSSSPSPSESSRNLADEDDYSRSSTDTLNVLDSCWTNTLNGHTGSVTCLYFEDSKLVSYRPKQEHETRTFVENRGIGCSQNNGFCFLLHEFSSQGPTTRRSRSGI